MKQARRKEQVFPKIYLLAYADWMNGYKLSKIIYPDKEKAQNNIYETIEKNKEHFNVDSRGYIHSKPDLLVNIIDELSVLTNAEKNALTSLFDSDSFRTLIGFSKLLSVETAIMFIKQIFFCICEIDCIVKDVNYNADNMKNIDPESKLAEFEQIVKKEFKIRDIDVWNDVQFNMIGKQLFDFNFLVRKTIPYPLIVKLSELPFPALDDYIGSATTSSCLKAIESMVPTD